MDQSLQKLLKLRNYPKDFQICSLCIEDLKASDLEKFIEDSCKEGLVKLIVIYNTLTVSNKKITFYKSLCDLDIFEHKYLNLLLDGHRLIPRHELLSLEDRLVITRTYNEKDLPLLSFSDPIARLYDFKVDDIIKIHRPRGVYFRLVKDV